MVLAGMAWGQATAPATRKGETPEATARRLSDWKANITARTIPNPQFEAILSKVPATLLPPFDKESTDKAIARSKQRREWDKTNMDGKPIKVTAAVVRGTDAEFYIPGKTLQRVEVHVSNGALGDYQAGQLVTIEGEIGKGMISIVIPTPDDKRGYSHSLVIINPKVTKVEPTTKPAT